MADTDAFKLEFTGVYVQAANCALVTSEAEEFANKQIDHTYAYLFYDGKWYLLKQWPNAVVSMAHLSNGPTQLFFLTANGKVYRRASGTITEEIVDTSDEGPSDLLLMRRMIALGDELVAVGMARRAYRRSVRGAWSAIDASCFVARKDRTSATGFNDVVACESGLIAVGYKGEIWVFDGSMWRLDASPTNVNLTCITPTSTGEFVVAGLGGMLLLGSPGNWRLISHDVAGADFWSAVNFKGEVYLSSRGGVYRLTGESLHSVNLDRERAPTTAYLSCSSEVMWSAGTTDLYSTADAVTWLRMENP
jgi:hypothetical protein